MRDFISVLFLNLFRTIFRGFETSETRLRRVGSYSLEISRATFLVAGYSTEKISSCNDKLPTNCQLILKSFAKERHGFAYW